MRAKDFIEFLQGVDPEMDVRGMDSGCGCCASSRSVDVQLEVRDFDGWDEDVKTDEFVYIESLY